MTAPQNPRVTQADREAAADLQRYSCGPASEIKRLRSGELDDDYCVQAFARHREAAEAASKAREAALVEALTVAANRLDLWHVSAIASGNEALRCKLANWCEEARAALTNEPDA